MNKQQVRSVQMDWTISNVTHSDYFYTLHGQLEYWLLWAMMSHHNVRWDHTPPFWAGAQNSIGLYLEHASYSPFLDHSFLGRPDKDKLTWDMRDVPKGQKDTVDENFIPKAWLK